LTEAMACGCIPIVTNIPAAMKVILNGKAGYFYERGDEEALYKVLHNLRLADQPAVAKIVRKTFEAELSPTAIARKLIAICRQLQPI